MNYTLTKATEFAASWVEAWNSHDLDRIAAHYSQDVVFSSPLVRTTGGGTSNSIRGSAPKLSQCRSSRVSVVALPVTRRVRR